MYLGIGSLVSLAMLVLFIEELFRDEKDRESGATDKRDSDESDNLLTKSESACSSASGFADQSTEKWVRNLKYDSLNKYVKDW